MKPEAIEKSLNWSQAQGIAVYEHLLVRIVCAAHRNINSVKMYMCRRRGRRRDLRNC